MRSQCDLGFNKHRVNKVNHSTETALLKIHNDIFRAISFRRKVGLVSLDLSAAFDTLNHDILLGRLRSIGLSDSALTWFRSYLSGRTSTVRINNQYSPYQLIRIALYYVIHVAL